MQETLLDVRGLRCPLPVLKANKAIKALAPGALLRVLTTDPASPADVRAFCETMGHELVSATEAPGDYVFLLRKKAAAA
jgi:tRNA 2-thiouridine synthesizing protein A